MISVEPHEFLDGRWVIKQDGKDSAELAIYRTGDAYSVTLNSARGLLWRGMLKNGRVMGEREFLEWALGPKVKETA